MKRQGFDDIQFFVGTEVEHTPMHSNTTLFVVGLQPIKDILKHVAHHPDWILQHRPETQRRTGWDPDRPRPIAW